MYAGAMDIAACFRDYFDYAREGCKGFSTLVYRLFCPGDGHQYLNAAMRSLDGLRQGRGRAFKAGHVRYAISYWLNAFSFFATASRSASAAARRCALGADCRGIALGCNVVVAIALQDGSAVYLRVRREFGKIFYN